MCNELLNNKEYINYQTDEKLDLKRVSTLPDNAMLKVRPDLWCEWDFEKNDELGFDIWKITKGTHKKPYWQCTKCKSRYETNISNKTRGKSCPYCSGQKVNHTNSLAKIRPELLKEWNFELNLSVTPYTVTLGTHKKAYWNCPRCKSVYQTSIQNRTKGTGCPYCASKKVNHTNSLAILNPELASQWHPTKNGELTPHDVTYGSKKNVWWLGTCGHEFNSTVESFNRYKGCPYCSNRRLLVGFNDMWTTNTELASLLANPEDGHKYMQCVATKVDWKCPDCGSILKNKSINNVSRQGLSCNVCKDSLSIGEKIMYQLLTISKINFLYNKGTNFSSRLKYDFIIEEKEMIIEMHGLQHYKDTGFHKMNGKDAIQEFENDALKREIAINNGFINYIEIDCRRSDFEFIKNNIIDSGMLEILNIKECSFGDINLEGTLMNKCWDMWNNGYKKVEISESLNLGRNTVAKYIKIKESVSKQNKLIG